MAEELERGIASVFGAQAGVVRRRQLIDLGVSPRTMTRRITAGVWRAHGRTVVALPGLVDDLRTRSLVLGQRAHPRGVLTGPAAVVLHGADREAPWDAVDLRHEPPWLLHPGNCRLPGRVIRPEPAAAVTVFGTWVAPLDDALLDLLRLLPLADARALAYRAAQTAGAGAVADLALSDAARGGRGARRLTALAADLGAGVHAESERTLLELIRDCGLEGFSPNHPVRLSGTLVLIDVAFPEARLAIEVDGQAWHTAPDRFQRDRQRQNTLVNAGWRVLRFTWWDLRHRPQQVIGEIVAALG